MGPSKSPVAQTINDDNLMYIKKLSLIKQLRIGEGPTLNHDASERTIIMSKMRSPKVSIDHTENIPENTDDYQISYESKSTKQMHYSKTSNRSMYKSSKSKNFANCSKTSLLTYIDYLSIKNSNVNINQYGVLNPFYEMPAESHRSKTYVSCEFTFLI
jgi:hypothetical protein